MVTSRLALGGRLALTNIYRILGHTFLLGLLDLGFMGLHNREFHILHICIIPNLLLWQGQSRQWHNLMIACF